MIGKRGELTSRQIVIISILIVSFAVILIFFFTLNLRGGIDKESCRNSVLLRGTPLGKATSLNCQTQDVCISKGEGCKESLRDTVEVKVENKEQLLDELGDLMYDCHWQMGAGKVDYTPTNWGKDRNYCAICDRIYFGDDLKQDTFLYNIPNKDLFDSLETRKIPNGDISILQFLYGVSSFKNIESDDENLEAFLNVPFDFRAPQGYTIVTGLRKDSIFGGRIGGVLIGIGGTVAGTAIVIVGVVGAPFTGGTSLGLTPIGVATIVGAGAVGGIVGYNVGAWVEGPGDTSLLPPSLLINDQKFIEDQFNCYQFSTLA